jgi:hypothetical protein
MLHFSYIVWNGVAKEFFNFNCNFAIKKKSTSWISLQRSIVKGLKRKHEKLWKKFKREHHCRSVINNNQCCQSIFYYIVLFNMISNLFLLSLNKFSSNFFSSVPLYHLIFLKSRKWPNDNQLAPPVIMFINPLLCIWFSVKLTDVDNK